MCIQVIILIFISVFIVIILVFEIQKCWDLWSLLSDCCCNNPLRVHFALPRPLKKDSDPTASKHLPRTHTKPPAQRRPLASVLFPQTTVHRHRGNHLQASPAREPHKRASLARRRAPDLAHLLSRGVGSSGHREVRRGRHPSCFSSSRRNKVTTEKRTCQKYTQNGKETRKQHAPCPAPPCRGSVFIFLFT